MARLRSKTRRRMKASSFAIPSRRAYPIHDLSHARNALARSSGKSVEAQVRAAVYKRYPSLRKRKKRRG